jgi:hypothetical protein
MAITFGLVNIVVASEWGDLLEAVGHLVNALVQVFGPTLTGVILVVGFIGSLLYRWRQERRREQVYELVSQEKERSIERLSKENLGLRVVLFKQLNWSDDEIERFIMQNSFRDDIDTARALTSEHVARKALEAKDKATKEDNPDSDIGLQRKAP